MVLTMDAILQRGIDREGRCVSKGVDHRPSVVERDPAEQIQTVRLQARVSHNQQRSPPVAFHLS